MTKVADLHIHTYFSDSTSSPREVVEQAKARGVSCIAVTDHDTVGGIAQTMAAGQELGVEVITGIELSTNFQGKDIDILGYFFDWQHPTLEAKLAQLQTARLERMQIMLAKLTALGIKDISLEEVQTMTQGKSLGRPHLATLLVKKGHVGNIKAAFEKYLGEDGKAYVPKTTQTPYEAIELMRQVGGVAVMAHPMITNKDEIIASMAEAGLAGIEAQYPNCSENIIHYYEGIAKKYNLVVTGGSDDHGQAKVYTHIGKKIIPYENVEQLRARIVK